MVVRDEVNLGVAHLSNDVNQLGIGTDRIQSVRLPPETAWKSMGHGPLCRLSHRIPSKCAGNLLPAQLSTDVPPKFDAFFGMQT